MKITVLDAATLGEDLSLEPLKAVGECEVFQNTPPELVPKRIAESDVVVINKVKLNESNLCDAKLLKLICIAATGYDNIDINYCRSREIGVCNVVGYSSHSVAQLTAATVLALSVNLLPFNSFVTSGEYSKSGVANKLSPVYHELFGKTWGIVGYGNIGKEVGSVARALGCRLVVCKRTPVAGVECVDIDTLCRMCDIITVHTPLNDSTRAIINADRIAKMKDGVILVNEARGAVTDEVAVAQGIKSGKIGAFGCDVYSTEPFSCDHPFYEIKDMQNVILTPHMAWGAYEARVRCLDEIVANIKDFFSGGTKGRVDIQKGQ